MTAGDSDPAHLLCLTQVAERRPPREADPAGSSAAGNRVVPAQPALQRRWTPGPVHWRANDSALDPRPFDHEIPL
jgi:hypothetical protein